MTTFEAIRDEAVRLTQHFDDVIAELRYRDTRALSPEQLERRTALVAELARYRDRGGDISITGPALAVAIALLRRSARQR